MLLLSYFDHYIPWDIECENHAPPSFQNLMECAISIVFHNTIYITLTMSQ